MSSNWIFTSNKAENDKAKAALKIAKELDELKNLKKLKK